MADQNEFWTLFMIPVTVSAMVLCITAYGMVGIVIVWTQRTSWSRSPAGCRDP